jgi:hypothetical protein
MYNVVYCTMWKNVHHLARLPYLNSLQYMLQLIHFLSRMEDDRMVKKN